MGALISISSDPVCVFYLVRTLLYGSAEAGWPTLAVAVSFLGGVQILSIGILGEYIGRIYEEVKGRPTYLVSRVVTLAEQSKRDEQ